MTVLNYRKVGNQLILVFFDRDPISIDTTHPNYQKIVDLVKEFEDSYGVSSNGIELRLQEDLDKLISLADMVKTVSNWIGDGPLEIRDGNIYYNNEPQHGFVVDKIFQLLEDGEDATPLIKFLERLLKNPLSQVREQLFGFLEYGKNAITPDGHFLAYKYVTDDFKSCHAGSYDENGVYDPNGQFDHSIGSYVSMPRERCDNDPDRTCSAGLHVCSREYLNYMSGRQIVVCMVDPADVVAVPNDYNNTKMRTCAYKVVGKLTKDEVERDVLASSAVNRDYDRETNYLVEEKPSSSFIKRIEYDAWEKELVVDFVNQQRYIYESVPLSIGKGFINADAHSDFFHRFVKDSFIYKQF